MKNIWIMLIMGVIALNACSFIGGGGDYSFAEGFADLAVLDAQYNVSFKEEKLGKWMVTLEDVDTFLEKLREIEKNVQKTKESRDKEALLIFIDIRKGMIVAGKNYQLAQNIGDIGLVQDGAGYSCGEAKYILDTAYLLNQSFVTARKVISALDDLLYQYQDVEQLQELVGLNQNKTQFYKSPLDEVSKTIRLNHEALEKNCKIRVVTKEEKDL